MSAVICRNEKRRSQVRLQRQLNGLDYLEVGKPDDAEPTLAGQRHLRVFFLGKAAVELDAANVRIEGGRRIRGIRVLEVAIQHYESPDLDDYMDVTVDRPGDFSAYTLRVVERDEQGNWRPHSAFDARYDRVGFSFKIDCPNELDCKQEPVCPPEPAIEPDIDYLARDYASFRQLIFDRLAQVMPDWKERHVPDLGVALVEVLAYVGDHLSYYQDAVATEAYLATARKRVSVRRHARLVDYNLHEGCNARAFLCIATDSDQSLNADDVCFVTGFDGTLPAAGSVLTRDDLRQVQRSSFEVFEPLGDGVIELRRDHGRIHFYTWGDTECCLPAGATEATLVGELVPGTAPDEPPCEQGDNSGPAPQAGPVSDETALIVREEPAPQLHLQPGDILVFEEVIGPETGHPGDADPERRHAVRLTGVEAGVDPLNGSAPVVTIRWHEDDALPFPLCLSALGPPPGCELLDHVSVACGNVVLVDHGETKAEDLGCVPEGDTLQCCKGEGMPADREIVPGHYRPTLACTAVTFSEPPAMDAPAAAMLSQDVRLALPQVRLIASPGDVQWRARRDLLASGGDEHHFVVEVDDDARAQLRFGDDDNGERPDAGLSFRATYRTGNGEAGNVGADAISHLVLKHGSLSGARIRIRNPLPAHGGTAPEPTIEAKLFAPHAFRDRLQRAVTAGDYASIAEREFGSEVQRAAAKLRWAGSGYEVLVALDPRGADEASPALLDTVTRRLHRYRRMGHDLIVRSAVRVPLDIGLIVCVLPDYLRGHVKAELRALFSNRVNRDGRRGYFHPDSLSFGDGIHVSGLVAAVQGVEGVESVGMKRLQRLNEPPNREIENGVLPLGPFEIAQLDNDPSVPENGLLELDMRGGR